MKKTSNIVLIILAIFITIFTGLCLWLFYMYQSIPDTLVTCFYGTIVGELFVCGMIKVMKVKKGENKNDL